MNWHCEHCVFFSREHLLDAFLHHTVVYDCAITNEKVFPQHGSCRYFVERTGSVNDPKVREYHKRKGD